LRVTDTILPQPAGLSVLIVEDHALIALDLETILLDLGAGPVTIANSVEQALHLVATRKFDAAFLDVRIGEDSSIPVAVSLRDKGVPFVIATGYDAATELPAEFRTRPHIAKPFKGHDIANAWKMLVGVDRGP
jgi:CheY-like chemotaxis protein